MNQNSPQQVRSISSAVSHVSCGGEHTLALTSEGEAYSWGRGTWGQCGNGTTDNTCRPAKIQALIDQEVVQIASGSKHSLVLTAANEILSFGAGELGQLGTGVLSPSLSPKKVSGLPPLPILYISAGGDQSFAVLETDHGAFKDNLMNPSEPSESIMSHHGKYLRPHNPLPSLLSLCSQALSALASSSSSSSTPAAALAAVMAAVSHKSSASNQATVPEVQKLVLAIENIFTSVGYLTAGFALPTPQGSNGVKRAAGSGISAVRDLASSQAMSKNKSSPSSSSVFFGALDEGLVADHNIDVASCQTVFASIIKVYDVHVITALGHSCLKLLIAVEKHVRPDTIPSQLEWALPLLLILFLNPLNGEPLAMGQTLMSQLVRMTLSLPHNAQEVLAQWLSRLPVELFGGRIIRPIQRYLSALSAQGIPSSSSSISPKREEVMRAASILDLLFDANERMGAPVPFSEFHNKTLSDTINLRDEYMLFAEMKNSGRVSSRNQAGINSAPLLSICQASLHVHSPLVGS